MRKTLYISYRIIAVLGILLVASFVASAQTTKVKGRVTDKDTGEGLPFVGIYFKGTQTGVTTDLEGNYMLEARDLGSDVVVAFLLGYESQEEKIHLDAYNHIDFALKVSSDLLEASVVKPDDSYVKWILSQVSRHRKRNDPEEQEKYRCHVYNKMEMDLSNPEKNLNWKAFSKRFGFVMDYVDTSVISGTSYLPVMLSEAVTKRYHDKPAGVDKEVIEASQISGLNPENALLRMTGSLHMKIDFYKNFIQAGNLNIPSPLSSNGSLYYNYYLIDSLQIDRRKTYKIRFHPKKFISSPSLDGEMSIDAMDFALRDLHARLQKRGNVNWIRDLVIGVEHEKLGDSVWFYKNEKLYADFSLFLSDSSELASVIGRRELLFYDVALGKETSRRVEDQKYAEELEENANRRSPEYWSRIRPYELSQKEQNIYKMVESVKQVPAYKNIYKLVNTFAVGYWDIGPIGLGTYDQLTSYNQLEGRRFQLGLRTNRHLSRKFRFTGYAAYGLKDHRWKGGGDVEYVFGNPPMRKLFAHAQVDMCQLGRGEKAFSETNVLSNLFAKGGGGYVKKSCVDEFLVRYEHEINTHFSNMFSFSSKRIHANDYVPMFRPDSTAMSSVAENYLRYTMRFSWDETVVRGTYENHYLYTKYPVITLDFFGGFKGLRQNDYNFARAEATISYHLQLPPIGTSKIKFNAGKIFGKVPYPLLKLHEGNSTYFVDPSAFACMDYYEFASDAWVSCLWEHNFEGFFLGKIPLVRKLNLREIFNVKAVYGTISDQNDGSLGPATSQNAFLLFPEGMKELKTPYVEVGVGISNIFRLFRIDFNWRLTHARHEIGGKMEKVPHRMSVNVGFEINF